MAEGEETILMVGCSDPNGPKPPQTVGYRVPCESRSCRMKWRTSFMVSSTDTRATCLYSLSLVTRHIVSTSCEMVWNGLTITLPLQVQRDGKRPTRSDRGFQAQSGHAHSGATDPAAETQQPRPVRLGDQRQAGAGGSVWRRERAQRQLSQQVGRNLCVNCVWSHKKHFLSSLCLCRIIRNKIRSTSCEVSKNIFFFIFLLMSFPLANVWWPLYL